MNWLSNPTKPPHLPPARPTHTPNPYAHLPHYRTKSPPGNTHVIADYPRNQAQYVSPDGLTRVPKKDYGNPGKRVRVGEGGGFRDVDPSPSPIAPRVGSAAYGGGNAPASVPKRPMNRPEELYSVEEMEGGSGGYFDVVGDGRKRVRSDVTAIPRRQLDGGTGVNGTSGEGMYATFPPRGKKEKEKKKGIFAMPVEAFRKRRANMDQSSISQPQPQAQAPRAISSTYSPATSHRSPFAPKDEKFNTPGNMDSIRAMQLFGDSPDFWVKPPPLGQQKQKQHQQQARPIPSIPIPTLPTAPTQDRIRKSQLQLPQHVEKKITERTRFLSPVVESFDTDYYYNRTPCRPTYSNRGLEGVPPPSHPPPTVPLPPPPPPPGSTISDDSMILHAFNDIDDDDLDGDDIIVLAPSLVPDVPRDYTKVRTREVGALRTVPLNVPSKSGLGRVGAGVGREKRRSRSATDLRGWKAYQDPGASLNRGGAVRRRY